jgi:hypothetical protein
MGLNVFNQLKLKNVSRDYVDKILKASITPYVWFWINSLKVHEIYNCLSTLQDNHHRGAKGGSIQGVFLFKDLRLQLHFWEQKGFITSFKQKPNKLTRRKKC